MSICTVTPLEFRELLARQPDLPLVDVRMPTAFREVHVAGAKNIPFQRLTAEQLLSLGGQDENSTVYFICERGVRSAAACEKAQRFGLSNVADIEGGTDACIDAAVPVERGKPAFSLERQVRITAGSLIVVAGVLAVTAHPLWALLAALVGAGLVFSGVTNTCNMGMVLARMPWNQGGLNRQSPTGN